MEGETSLDAFYRGGSRISLARGAARGSEGTGLIAEVKVFKGVFFMLPKHPFVDPPLDALTLQEDRFPANPHQTRAPWPGTNPAA